MTKEVKEERKGVNNEGVYVEEIRQGRDGKVKRRIGKEEGRRRDISKRFS